MPTIRSAVRQSANFDPLSQRILGSAALLGDAAHTMYPFGSNGASQAILDTRVLAWQLATQPDIEAVLQAPGRL